MVHEVQLGTRKRMSFSRINEVLDMPNLIEVQKNSYQRFVDEDLREVLADISPITDYSENLVLEFIDYSIDLICRQFYGLGGIIGDNYYSFFIYFKSDT